MMNRTHLIQAGRIGALVALVLPGPAAFAQERPQHAAADGAQVAGRGLVPSTQNEVADQVIGTALDIGGAVAQFSDNLIVKGVGIAAPALAPGRGLAMGEKPGAKPQPTTFAGGGPGAGAVIGTPIRNDMPAAPAFVPAGPGPYAYTTLTISIPTFMGGANRQPLQPLERPDFRAQHFMPLYNDGPGILARSTPQPIIYHVKCLFDNTVAYAQNVDACEGAGGLVIAAD